jgi:hypothetical protein
MVSVTKTANETICQLRSLLHCASKLLTCMSVLTSAVMWGAETAAICQSAQRLEGVCLSGCAAHDQP